MSGYSLNRSASNNDRFIHLKAMMIFAFFMCPSVSAIAEPGKHYLAIEKNIYSDENDLDIISVGMLSLEDNIASLIKLSYLNSDINGEGGTLDLGGGYTYNAGVSLYVLFAVSLGYNWDTEDTIAAYFPEAGIVMDFTDSFSISVSGKRYFNLYEKDEDIVMFGLLFRN